MGLYDITSGTLFSDAKTMDLHVRDRFLRPDAVLVTSQ